MWDPHDGGEILYLEYINSNGDIIVQFFVRCYQWVAWNKGSMRSFGTIS